MMKWTDVGGMDRKTGGANVPTNALQDHNVVEREKIQSENT